MKTPLVTVLLPCYNSEKYIKKSIESIIHQTYNKLEIIVLDDGSTDNSLEIINTCAKADSRIKVLKHDKNETLIPSLNEMISLAEGEYIARMDADDVSVPERIEKQIKYLETNYDIDVCGSSVIVVDEKGEKRGIRRVPCDSKYIKELLPFGNVIVHSSIVGRAKIFKQFIYDMNYVHAEDYELWCRLVYSNNIRISNIKETLLYYRVSGSQITQKYWDNQKKISFEIVKKYKLVPETNYSLHNSIFFEYGKNISLSNEEKKIIEDYYKRLRKLPYSCSVTVMKKMLIFLWNNNKKMFYKSIFKPLSIYTIFMQITRNLL